MKPAARPHRLHRIFHWIGIVLALPFVGVAVLWIYRWLDGQLPATATLDDITLVVLMVLGLAAGVYFLCRGIAWAIVKLMDV
jgi:nitrate reductase gamma subunit